MDQQTLAHNLEVIRERIMTAVKKADRSSDRITLMAVTKTKPAETIRDLIELGLREFGENYPDETVEKMDAFKGDGVRISMIGHLQSRKAKLVADYFDCFQSVDNYEIAEKVDTLCCDRNKTMPVFLECNVGGEDSKGGWYFEDSDIPDSFLQDFERIQRLKHLQIKGLMILPPYTENGETNRPYFIRTRGILEYLNQYLDAGISELSMGTSIDYMEAIEEGATIVRIGTVLVGARAYPNKEK